MTQKEKLIKAYQAILMIKNQVLSLEREAEDYDMRFHRSYTSAICKKCDETLKMLK